MISRILSLSGLLIFLLSACKNEPKTPSSTDPQVDPELAALNTNAALDLRIALQPCPPGGQQLGTAVGDQRMVVRVHPDPHMLAGVEHHRGERLRIAGRRLELERRARTVRGG